MSESIFSMSPEGDAPAGKQVVDEAERVLTIF